MYKYGDTVALKEIVRTVQHLGTFIGLDDDGNPIYEDLLLPTIHFTGSVKLHGTNAAIGYDRESNELWFQSRSNKVSDGHFGFPTTISRDEAKAIIAHIVNYNKDVNCTKVVVYGEWAGSGIQKGVAISQLPKTFYVFSAAAIINEKKVWLKLPSFYDDGCKLDWIPDYIDNIYDYPTYQIDINFNQPSIAQEQIKKWVDAVENECPVAAAHGIQGVGEGIVWVGEYKSERLIFKTKGEKHSVTKEKRFTDSPEKLQKIKEFVEYAVTKPHVEQAIFELFGENSANASRQDTGKIVKWVSDDVYKEESNTLDDLGLEIKDVASYISKAAATIYLGIV